MATFVCLTSESEENSAEEGEEGEGTEEEEGEGTEDDGEEGEATGEEGEATGEENAEVAAEETTSQDGSQDGVGTCPLLTMALCCNISIHNTRFVAKKLEFKCGWNF